MTRGTSKLVEVGNISVHSNVQIHKNIGQSEKKNPDKFSD